MFAVSSDLHVTRYLFPHSEYVVINIITESLPYQVGVCAIRVQSWAKEYCKYSDGQGIARVPQFRWARSHFYLKHGCFAQLIKAHLLPRCPFLPGLKILCFGEVSVILLQMKCWGSLWIIPVALCCLTPERSWVGVRSISLQYPVYYWVCHPWFVPRFPRKVSWIWVAFLWSW